MLDKVFPNVEKPVKVFPWKSSQYVVEPTGAHHLAVEVSILIQPATQQG